MIYTNLMIIKTFVKHFTYFADTTLVNFSFGASWNTNVSQLYTRLLIDIKTGKKQR